MTSEISVRPIVSAADPARAAAMDLLAQFFREEGFSTPRQRIGKNLDSMLADSSCWAAMALAEDVPVGIVTVTTMLYIEWGRLAEVGDLYVLREYRRRGVARRLVAAAIEWSRGRGCSGAFVTITPDGEARHQLSRFYQRLEFRSDGRTTMSKALSE